MPYGIRETRKGYAVYNRLTGRVLATHGSREKAEAQRRIIVAAERRKRAGKLAGKLRNR